MSVNKYRILIIASHPIQYAVPLYRLMAQHPKLEILVAYCSLQGTESGQDQDFGTEIIWDIPLLDGYPWIQVPNLSPQPGLNHFWGLINLGLAKQILTGNFDVVITYTGYIYSSFWITLAAVKVSRTAFIFGTDTHELAPRDRRFWKVKLKKIIWSLLFRLANTVIVSSSGGVKLMRSLGISEQHLQLTPNVVNNPWWQEQAALIDRTLVRQQWQIPDTGRVILFCAKFQPWKRPQDVLQAFAQGNVADSYLVLAGEGPLRSQLETEAEALGVMERVRFLGFVNQSQLPAVYKAADLFVLPSEYEPFGLVVNEAMLCGCAVAVSDRIGACYDIVDHGKTGFVYPCGEIEALVKIFQEHLPNLKGLDKIKEAARQRMKTWSPEVHVETIVQAIEKAI